MKDKKPENGWYWTKQITGEDERCPKCNAPTQTYIVNDGANDDELNLGERCPKGHFTFMHDVAVED